jgi:Protein DA1
MKQAVSKSGIFSPQSFSLTVMPVQCQLKTLFVAVAVMALALTALAQQNCAICGQPIIARDYLWTDKVTHQQVVVCSKCNLLPPCFICGLPVKDGQQLSDGRWLCARDGKTAVMDVSDVQRIFGQVHDYLDRMYARFTLFPTNVDVSVIDRVDVDSMFQMVGNSFESPDVLGVTQPVTNDGVKRYEISLLTGQPLSQMEEVCAHELSHAWVGENVPPERHARIDRDAEEGFCEMMGYLLVDAMGEEGEKQRVLANTYTRGQVQLFIEAEQQYGFDEILDWMKYGVAGRLEEDHLDTVRDVKMPVDAAVANVAARLPIGSKPPPPPSTLQLQGIMWSGAPSAIINGHSFFAGDEYRVPVGQSEVTIRCLSITKTSVQIQDVDSGKKEQLQLQANQLLF